MLPLLTTKKNFRNHTRFTNPHTLFPTPNHKATCPSFFWAILCNPVIWVLYFSYPPCACLESSISTSESILSESLTLPSGGQPQHNWQYKEDSLGHTCIAWDWFPVTLGLLTGPSVCCKQTCTVGSEPWCCLLTSLHFSCPVPWCICRVLPIFCHRFNSLSHTLQ